MVDWKKEISFGGKKRKDEPPADVESAPAAPAEQTSIWKKEIGFGRKPKSATPEPVGVEAETATGGETSVPFWKKEITFGRKKAEAAPPPPTAQAEYDLNAPAAVELLDAYVAPNAGPDEPAPWQPVAVPGPHPAEPVVPAEAVLPEPPIADVVDLLAAVQEATVDPVAQMDLSFPAPAPEPVVPAPEPVVPAPEPVAPVPVAPEPVAPLPAAQVQPAPPVPPAAAVVVHPPVPSAQLPPLHDEDSRKKRRKKKEKAAKPEGERVPFYKRELGRKKKESAEPAPAPAAAGDDVRDEPKQKAKGARPSFSLPRLEGRGGKKPGKMPKRVIGLKVGASQLAAAAVTNNGHAEVVQVARMALDPGIVMNGELRDPDRLAEALKAFFAEHKLPKRGVRLGIATNRIGVRTLEISGIADPKQLANAIRFRAQEALPIPIDEAVLDYQVLSEGKNDDGETVRKILLVLAYRDLIDRYVAACRKAGLQLAGIDLEAFALLRALAAPREDGSTAQAALVAVTIGHDRTTFAVSDGRVCEFTRVLDWGGHSLNVAIARALDRAPSEADAVKRELALDTNAVPEGLTAEQAQKARDAARVQVQTFARELVSSLQFYQNQPGSLGIGEIVVTGGTAHLGGLVDELQRLIGVRVRIGDPLVRVKVAKKIREPEQLGSFAVAIGLGIED